MGKRSIVVTAVVALVIGAGGGYAVGRLASGGESDDATAACSGIARWAERVDLGSDGWVDPLSIESVFVPAGAGSFAQAAAYEDGRYEKLGEFGIDVQRAVTRVDWEAAEQGIDAMLDECDRLGL